MVKVYSPLLARPVVQGRATGNGGVPVVWGLGGGSGTAVSFQSLVCFRAQSAELTGSALPESAPFSVFFSMFLVWILFAPPGNAPPGNTPPENARPTNRVHKCAKTLPLILPP